VIHINVLCVQIHSRTSYGKQRFNINFLSGLERYVGGCSVRLNFPR